jgi:hypothetical protein
MQIRRPLYWTVVALVCSLWVPLGSRADQSPGASSAATQERLIEPTADKDESAADASDSLATSQDAIASRFKRFEKTLLQMAEQMRKTDPERADLLVRAIGRSKQNQIDSQMARIVVLLGREQFGDALERQDELLTNLNSLLDLLQSENRRDDIEREKERLEDLLRNLSKLIGKEKGIRAATERGGDPDGLADRQGDVAQETDDLVKKIDAQDKERNSADGRDSQSGESRDGNASDGDSEDGSKGEGDPKDGESKPGDSKEGESKEGESKEGQPGDDPGDSKPGDNDSKPGDNDSKPSDGKPSDGDPSDGKPSDGKPSEGQPSEGQPSEGQPSEGQPSDGDPSEGQPSEGQPSEGQPSDGDPSDGQPQDSSQESGSQDPNRTPGRDQIEQAKRDMERAIEELKKRNRDKASDAQDEALRKLVEAKEQLEEILRQLREEERQLLLAALEARFQKMLAMQLMVYQGTVEIGKVDEGSRTGLHTNKAVKLARDEEQIVLEAGKALVLLREEGSSVAFPEAVEQMQQDMLTVSRLLERTKVDELTQGIEQDIIEQLEEIIEALQKEMDKPDDDQQDGESDQGEPQDPELVDQLAELKMLRGLQLRINRRTRRLGTQIEAEQATDPDIVTELQKLGRRQARIQEATYDLATGKNK